MAVSAEQFKNRFPEFINADDSLVEAVLEEAALLCPDAVWGDFTDQGVKLAAAQKLARQPTAREMALNPDGTTVYDQELELLRRIVSSGGRVI